jgi:flagellar capping protein FliD
MAAFNKFNSFVEALAEKVHDLGSDTLKVMLTNTAPVATNAVKVDITELAAGNGYTAGGNTAAVSASSQTSGTYKLVLADPTTWTAVGGTIGPFRYAVLYNDTASNDELIAWWDYGASLTLNAGETFTVDFDASTGVLTIV